VILSTLKKQKVNRKSGVGTREMEDDCNGPTAEERAAIPEASPEVASVRRGKHQAGAADSVVGSKAEKMKALRNEGDNKSLPTFINIVDSSIIANLDGIVVLLGEDTTGVSKSVCSLKRDVEI
jgi:hypothetical protein